MTEKQEWTANLVLEHVKAIMAANDQRYQEHFKSAEKAVQVAEENAKQWRSGANEWRAAMTDREKTFATQADVKSIKERLDLISGGSKGIRDIGGLIFNLIMAAVAIISLLFMVLHK